MYKEKNLALESEVHADLVRRLVELLGVEGCANAESDARSDSEVVGKSGHTPVIDLGLFPIVLIVKFECSMTNRSY